MSFDSGQESDRVGNLTQTIRVAAQDKSLMRRRAELARFAVETLSVVGSELHVLGHLIDADSVKGVSPFGHGSDETVAVSLLFRITTQLVSASVDLFGDGRHYGAAALLLQLVEIEYLSWAIEARDREGQRWLRSDRQTRESFFTPAKLRAAAQGKFRGKDYSYHCELGGHPVPGAGVLLGDDQAVSQLLLADLLGHVGRIWDHLVGWARQSDHGEPILSRSPEMSSRFAAWKSVDPLAELPPPS